MNKLNKPYTKRQRADFVVNFANSNEQNMKLVETDEALYALLEDEILKDGEILKDENFETKRILCQKQNRIADIKNELYEIDLKTIRPIRAGETEKLQELEAMANVLRDELHELEGEN